MTPMACALTPSLGRDPRELVRDIIRVVLSSAGWSGLLTGGVTQESADTVLGPRPEEVKISRSVIKLSSVFMK